MAAEVQTNQIFAGSRSLSPFLATDQYCMADVGSGNGRKGYPGNKVCGICVL